jgi:phosphoglycolate phosphatase-like HAD superfamily hydrolase
MQKAGKKLNASEKKAVERLEIQAVEAAHVYEDVAPALAQLKAMGVKLLITSSLSAAAVNRFLAKSSLKEFFSGVWNRDNAGGVKDVPLTKAMASAAFDPEHVMSLSDTEDGLNVAQEVGVNSILMINDYDEGRRLAMHPPTGGIVSLAELPDAIRFVAESAKLSRS